ncbi:hypothetical protein HELRODRAFT_176843 [Helobdella robusta]|uniref:Uncharacterized protein n=1 Tax=Helobdella robusta TaxID=6412 RepID=T1FAY5_HELRO|nr:hypothetical protein HELRODRAFT_176843 [Helobdella robusta]ESN98383.1 hypothetical protein HELRODRAFT_176843 [Helobdella robusta]
MPPVRNRNLTNSTANKTIAEQINSDFYATESTLRELLKFLLRVDHHKSIKLPTTFNRQILLHYLTSLIRPRVNFLNITVVRTKQVSKMNINELALASIQTRADLLGTKKGSPEEKTLLQTRANLYNKLDRLLQKPVRSNRPTEVNWIPETWVDVGFGGVAQDMPDFDYDVTVAENNREWESGAPGWTAESFDDGSWLKPSVPYENLKLDSFMLKKRTARQHLASKFIEYPEPMNGNESACFRLNVGRARRYFQQTQASTERPTTPKVTYRTTEEVLIYYKGNLSMFIEDGNYTDSLNNSSSRRKKINKNNKINNTNNNNNNGSIYGANNSGGSGDGNFSNSGGINFGGRGSGGGGDEYEENLTFDPSLTSEGDEWRFYTRVLAIAAAISIIVCILLAIAKSKNFKKIQSRNQYQQLNSDERKNLEEREKKRTRDKNIREDAKKKKLEEQLERMRLERDSDEIGEKIMRDERERRRQFYDKLEKRYVDGTLAADKGMKKNGGKMAESSMNGDGYRASGEIYNSFTNTLLDFRLRLASLTFSRKLFNEF